jgi:hypothetical protein
MQGTLFPFLPDGRTYTHKEQKEIDGTVLPEALAAKKGHMT